MLSQKTAFVETLSRSASMMHIIVRLSGPVKSGMCPTVPGPQCRTCQQETRHKGQKEAMVESWLGDLRIK